MSVTKAAAMQTKFVELTQRLDELADELIRTATAAVREQEAIFAQGGRDGGAMEGARSVRPGRGTSGAPAGDVADPERRGPDAQRAVGTVGGRTARLARWEALLREVDRRFAGGKRSPETIRARAQALADHGISPRRGALWLLALPALSPHLPRIEEAVVRWAFEEPPSFWRRITRTRRRRP